MTENSRLINKVRPLIAHNGWLVAVNNALFLSGSIYLNILKSLCADGYMNLETIIPIPNDCIGNPNLTDHHLPADPSPFNHATKIAILRILRKSKNK
jgi:23S rRNA (cytosine1962-C5)-methyltransferase